MLNKNFNKKSGFTLIEVIVCMVVLAIVITQILIISQNSYKTSKHSERRLIAYLIATEQQERLKAYYLQTNPSTDSEWDTFVSNVDDKCIEWNDTTHTSLKTVSCSTDNNYQIPFTKEIVSSDTTINGITAEAFDIKVSWKNNMYGTDTQSVNISYTITKGM